MQDTSQQQLVTADGQHEIISFAVLPSFHQVTSLDKRGFATAWVDQTTLDRREAGEHQGRVVLSREAWEAIGKSMKWLK